MGGGVKRRESPPSIRSSKDYIDHIDQASNVISTLGADLPIPQDVQESTHWLRTTGPSEILPFRAEQIDRPRRFVSQCASTREKWWELSAPGIKGRRMNFAQLHLIN